MKTITAFDVAEYFIYCSFKEERKISNKKVQKLVYYAQAWALVLSNGPLFSERIEAWIHGPAIPELYKKYKSFGFNPIDSLRKGFNPDRTFNAEVLQILKEVWRLYGKYDADYLEILTHQEEPWISARSLLEFDESSNKEIPLPSMKNYYTLKLNDFKKNGRQEETDT
jgi:uncharacterized phage-associated protein